MKALEPNNQMLVEDDRQITDLEVGETAEKFKEYLDAYEGGRSEILQTRKFAGNLDLGKTYLGGMDMTRSDKIKAEERFPI